MTDNAILKQHILDMLKILKQIYQREKMLFACLIVSCVVFVVLCAIYLTHSKDVINLKERAKEYQGLAKQYEVLQGSVDALEKRATLSKGEGILKATQRIFDELGLTKKLKSAKVTNTEDLKINYLEETIDILAENLTMNEIVNILYRIEKMPMLISIKTLNIKRSFENPANLHLQISMSYYTKK